MRKLFFWCTTLVLFCITSAFAGVNVTSPVNGSTDSSPVHFAASASSGSTVSFMRIYVDNVSVYGIAASSLDTYVTMAAGSHKVVVQGWNNGLTVSKTTLLITVPSGPYIPPTAAIFPGIQNLTGWQSCDTCAGSGGNGSAAPHWMAQFQTTPSLDGSSAEFYIDGTTAYSDALWWDQLGPIPTATHFVYDLYFYYERVGAPQALEFDANQSLNGYRYVFGTECDFTGLKHWRVWGYGVHWQDTGISCTAAQTANVWHHLIWEFERTSGGHTHFIAVTVDGVRQSVNRYYDPLPNINVQELNVAFQMDENKTATPYHVWLDEVKLSAW